MKSKLIKFLTSIKIKAIKVRLFMGNFHLLFFKHHSIEPKTDLEGMDEKDIRDIVKAEIKNHKYSVCDILDISSMIKKIGSSQPEATAYFSAFAAAKALGIAQKAITTSFYYYCGVIDSFNTKYNAVMNSQKDQIETAITNEIDSLEEAISKNNDAIKELTAKNDALRAKAIALRAERSTRVGKMLKLIDTLSTIYNEFLSELKTQNDKCLKYMDKDNE